MRANSFFATYAKSERRRRREEDGRPLQWWERILDDYPELTATDEHLLRLFRDHGVDEKVGRRRPYSLYEAGEWDAVVRADPLYATLSAKETTATQKKVEQRPGVVMVRHGLEREMFAQYRPFKFDELGFDVEETYGSKDEGVFTRWTLHDHGKPVKHVHTRQSHYAVINRHRSVFDDEDITGYGNYVPDPTFDLDAHIQEQHGGVPPPPGDSHQFHQSWWRHIQRLHGGKPKRGRHRHARFGKYQYAPGEGRAKGVDVHPDAWPLLKEGGEVVYVAAEGCLKADAILSQSAPVVAYGSVTLWEDSKWRWLAEQYLSRFHRTVVVPDSDWSVNSLVRLPTLELTDILAETGITAVVAAPPQRDCADCGHESRVTHTGEVLPPAEHKYGVDDWLAEGHNLMDMRVERQTGDVEGEYYESQLRSVLERYATDAGILTASSGWLSDRSGLSPDQVDRRLHKLEGKNLVTLEPGPWSSSTSRRPPRRITVLGLERAPISLAEYLATN